MPLITNDTVRIYYETAGECLPLVLHHTLSDGLQGWPDARMVSLPDLNHFQAFLVASLIIEHFATTSLATASVHP